MSSFQGLIDVIETHGLFCALYAGRGMHYWHTPEAGGKVNKENLTQVERTLKQLGTDLIPAYSPQALGHSERMFGTFQGWLSQELRFQEITDIDKAIQFCRVHAKFLGFT